MMLKIAVTNVVLIFPRFLRILFLSTFLLLYLGTAAQAQTWPEYIWLLNQDTAAAVRQENREIDLHSDNSTPRGLWSDGTTMWVANNDAHDNKLYAYTLTGSGRGNRDETKEFDLHEDNTSPGGIWSDGTTMWVEDEFDEIFYAYTLTGSGRGNRDQTKEFMLGREATDGPSGLWTYGDTRWEPHLNTGRIQAYRVSDDRRIRAQEFSPHSDNGYPQAVWADANTIWVLNIFNGPMKVFAYTRPPPPANNEARLLALIVSAGGAPLGPVFRRFDSDHFRYTYATANADVRVAPLSTHYAATITVNGAAVASEGASDRIALELGDNTITIVVTAPDGTTQRTYTLNVSRIVPPPPGDARIWSVTADSRTYRIGDNIDIRITFSRNVDVTGTPGLTLLTKSLRVSPSLLPAGFHTGTADYQSGSGTNTLTFRYTVQAGDNSDDLDYLHRKFFPLRLNGGTITDSANGDAVELILPAPEGSLAANSNVVIDTAPIVIAVGAGGSRDGILRAGDHIWFYIYFSEAVNVDTGGGSWPHGWPQLILATGSTNRTAIYAHTSPIPPNGAGVPYFAYRVQEGDDSMDLDYVNTMSLQLNGGTITDLAGNAAVLTLPAPGSQGSLSDYNNIAIDAVDPTVTIIAPGGADAPFTATFMFSEDVTGFDMSDIMVGNGRVISFSGSGAVYTARITAPSAGRPVTLDVAANVAIEAAADGRAAENGNGNRAATQVEVRFSSIAVSPASVTTTEATGTNRTANFNVSLTRPPDSGETVTVSVVSSDTTEGTVNPSSLTFTASNYNTDQAVTVTGVDDVIDDGDVVYDINLMATSSNTGSGLHGARNVVRVTNTDDDTRGVTISVSTLTMNEGGRGTYTVRLNTQPTGNVTVTPGSDNADVTVSDALTFTTTDWMTPQMVTVTGADDNDSNNEIALIRHTVAGYGSVTTADHVTVTVTDDDPPLITVAAGASVTEGSAAVFTLTRSNTNDRVLAVTVAVAETGTFIDGTRPTMATFMDSSSMTSISVNTADDAINEGNGMITLTITGGGTTYRLGTPSSAVVMVNDNDGAQPTVPAITVTADSPTITEGNNAVFTLTASSAPAADLTVDFTIADPGLFAVAGSTGAKTAVIRRGATTVTHRITTVDDNMNEPQGTITLTLTGDPTYTLGAPSSAVVTVNDNDRAPIVPAITVTASPTTVTEGTAATFTLTASSAPATDLTVNFTIADPGRFAVAGSTGAKTAVIRRGQTTVMHRVTTNNDSMDEPHGTITLTLAAGTGYTLGTDREAVVRVEDDDPTIPVITVTARPTTVTEGTAAVFTLTASPAPTADLTVNFMAVDSGTFANGGTGTRTATIRRGTRTAMHTVTTDNDRMDEPHGTLTLTLTADTASPATYTLGAPSSAVVRVEDNDDPLMLSINSPTVTEGAGSTMVTLPFIVSLSEASMQRVTVAYADATTGSATSGTDYRPLTAGTLTFNAGVTRQPINVTVTGDNVDEANETVEVILSNPMNAVIGTAMGTGTITDDDTRGVIVMPRTLTVNEGGNGTYMVRLASQPTRDVTITPGSGDNTIATVSGVLTFTTANWSADQVVTVSGVDDSSVGDRNTTIRHTVAGGDYMGFTAGTVMVTVDDNDGPGVTVSRSTLTVSEGGNGTYTVRLNTQPATGNVTVTPMSSDTTIATVSSALTFDATDWMTLKMVTVTGAQDSDTADETVNIRHTVTATDPAYDNVNVSMVTVTVSDDEDPLITVAAGTTPVTEGTAAMFTLSRSDTDDDTLAVTVAVTETGTFIDGTRPTMVVFTGGSTTAAVSVNTADDAVDEPRGMITLTIMSGTGYDVGTAGAAMVEVTDNDTAGVTAMATGGDTTTSEGMDTATLRVALSSEPTANVMVTLTSSDPGEGRFTSPTPTPPEGPVTLTFTPANWSSAQMVEVTGQNDAIDDDNEAYRITFATGSTDSNYSAGSLTIPPVDLTNADDNDTRGVTVMPTSLTVTEGEMNTYTIVLTSEPTADVMITPDPNNPAATVSAALTFTMSNWRTPQTVTVSGAEDDDSDDESVNITHTVAGGDYGSNNVPAAPVAVMLTDDDIPGVTISVSTLTVAEGAGGSGNYMVRLNTQPAGNVAVTPMSSDSAAATVSGALTFTPTNWKTRQMVTVTGADDNDSTNETAIISHTVAGYGSVTTAAQVTVTVTDDDPPLITVAAGAPVTEGAAAMFTLTRGDTDDATLAVTVTIDDGAGDFITGTIPTMATFMGSSSTTSVSVNTADDAIDEAPGMITLTITGGGRTTYRVGTPSSATVNVADDDMAGVTAMATDANTAEDMTDNTATVTVRLNSQPAGNVVLDVSSSDTTEGTVAVSTLTFNMTNWNTPQTVTVTGVDDEDSDGHITYNIVFGVNAGMTADPLYDALADTTVALENLDDETAIVVNPSSVRTTELEGNDRTNSFNVTLSRSPAAGETVTISVVSSDTTEGTVSPRSLRFTASNYNTAQAVTVTGVDDAIDDDDVDYNIDLATTSSNTASSLHQNTNMVTVTNEDNDTRGVTVSAGSLFVAVDGSRNYTVVLGTQPTANVTITPSSVNPATTVSAALTFTTSNWNTAQTVTVSGVRASGDNGLTISHAISSTGDYSAVTVAEAQVLVNDTGEVVLAEEISRTILGVMVNTDYMTVNDMTVDNDDVVLSLTSIPTTSDTEDPETTMVEVTYAPVTTTVMVDGESVLVTEVPPAGISFGDPEMVTDMEMADDIINSADVSVRINRMAVMGENVLAQPVAVCLSASMTLQEQAGGIEQLRVYHYRSDEWHQLPPVDRPQALESSQDDQEDFVCGESRSFSPFAVGFSTGAGRSFSTQSWLARFGRLAASDAVEVLSARAESLHNRHRSYLKIAGKSVSLSQLRNFVSRELASELAREGASAGSGGFDTLLDRFSEYRSLAAMFKRGTSFSYSGSGGVSTVGGWTTWGIGRYGKIDSNAQGLAIDGEVIGGYMGVDYRWGRELLLGIAMSRSEGETDFSQNNNLAEQETSLSGIYPYMHWSPSVSFSSWLTVGYGFGDTEHSDNRGIVESDIEMWMAAAGFRRELFSIGDTLITLKGDALSVQVKSDGSGGNDGLESTTSDTQRYRFLVEGSYDPMTGFGGRLEVGGRIDAGDAEDGMGVDIGGELGYSSNYLDVVARGRWLAVHDDEAFEEWGASINMILRTNGSGRGWGFTLAPSWGGSDRSDVENLWHDEDRHRTLLYEPEPSSDGGMFPDRIEMILTYGVDIGNMLWVPYSEMNLNGSHIEHIRLGSRFDFIGGWLRDRLSIELYGERQTYLDNREEYRFNYQLSINH